MSRITELRTLVLQVLLLCLVLTQTDCGHFTHGRQPHSCFAPDAEKELFFTKRATPRRVLNCSNPNSRVCFNLLKKPTGFKVLVQTCPDVGKLRLQLTRSCHFERAPFNSKLKACNRKDDHILIKLPKRRQMLWLAPDWKSNKTIPGLVWSHKGLSRWGSWTPWMKGIECGQEKNVRERRSSPSKVDHDKFAVNDMKNCGTKQSCVRFGPKDCRHLECDYLLTYRVINHTLLTLEISGKTTGWVALGMSSDNKMGGDGVIACKSKNVMDPDHIEALSMAMNVPYSRPRAHQINDFNLVNSRRKDGHIYCNMTKVITNQAVSDSKVDLTNNWYQFYAKGDIDRNGVMLKHHETPPVSLETITMLRPFKTDSTRYEQQNIASSISTHSSTILISCLATIWMCFKMNTL